MTLIPDANIAAIIANATAIKGLCDQSISLLQPTGTFWNPAGVANNPMLSNGNLTAAATSPNGHVIPANRFFPPSGRIAEVHIDSDHNPGYTALAIIAASQSISNPPVSLAAVPAGLWAWRDDGYAAHAGASPSAPSFAQGDTIALFHNSDGKVYGIKNNLIIGDPVAGTGFLFQSVTGDPGGYTIALVFFGNAGSPVVTGNFVSLTTTLPAGAQLYQ